VLLAAPGKRVARRWRMESLRPALREYLERGRPPSG
jgi:hypothetical protein